MTRIFNLGVRITEDSVSGGKIVSVYSNILFRKGVEVSLSVRGKPYIIRGTVVSCKPSKRKIHTFAFELADEKFRGLIHVR